jgi:hypothetical protein
VTSSDRNPFAGLLNGGQQSDSDGEANAVSTSECGKFPHSHISIDRSVFGAVKRAFAAQTSSHRDGNLPSVSMRFRLIRDAIDRPFRLYLRLRGLCRERQLHRGVV